MWEAGLMTWSRPIPSTSHRPPVARARFVRYELLFRHAQRRYRIDGEPLGYKCVQFSYMVSCFDRWKRSSVEPPLELIATERLKNPRFAKVLDAFGHHFDAECTA